MTPKSSNDREGREKAGRVADATGSRPKGRLSGRGAGILGDSAQGTESWPLGFRDAEGQGSHRSMTAEMGAALERDLLLAGAPTEDPGARCLESG